MATIRSIDLARKAYDAYGRVTDHKNYQGLPMPLFDDLGETIQKAWCAAVDAVVNEVVTVYDDDELDPDL